MNASDNKGGGGGKLDQLQKELDELEKKALEEINKGGNKFRRPSWQTGIQTSDEQPQSVSIGSVDQSASKEESLVEESTSDTSEHNPTPAIHVQPNPDEPKQTIDINSRRTAKNLMIVGVVLFVICLLSIGAYVLATRGGEKAVATPAPTTAPIATPIVTLTPNPANAKNIYVNNECQYKISYPTTWTAEKDNTTGFITLESEDFNGSISGTVYKVSAGEGVGIACDLSVDEDLLDAEGGLKCEENSEAGVTCEKLTYGDLAVVNNEKYKYMGLSGNTLYSFVLFDPSAELNDILHSFVLDEQRKPSPPPSPTEPSTI
jgi:hypothetical protein